MPPDVRKGFAFPTTAKESSGGYAALVRQSLEEINNRFPVSRRLTAHQAAEPQNTSTA